jgi:hypothetical protein
MATNTNTKSKSRGGSRSKSESRTNGSGTGDATNPVPVKILSPADISKPIVESVYIPILNGTLYYRLLPAAKMREFLAQSGDNSTPEQRLDALAGHLSRIICNEDGSEFMSAETWMDTVSLDVMNEIADCLTDNRDNRGKASRR